MINEHLPEGYAEQMDWGMISWVVPLGDQAGHLQRQAALLRRARLAEAPHGAST